MENVGANKDVMDMLQKAEAVAEAGNGAFHVGLETLGAIILNPYQNLFQLVEVVHQAYSVGVTKLVFHIFMGEFLYGTPDCVARRYPDFR